MKKLLLLFLLIPSLLWAAPPARIYTYTTGQVINPEQVTANEDAIFNYLNRDVEAVADNSITSSKIVDGTILNIDIATTAAIAYSKLNLSSSITAGDIVATAVSAGAYTNTDLTVDAGGRITGASNGTVALASEVSGTLPVGNGGTGATAAANAAGGVVVPTGAVNAANGAVILDSSGYVTDVSVDTTALKTATSEVSVTAANANLTFTGTSYGFYPQVKCSTAGGLLRAGISAVSGLDGVPGTSYVTYITMYSDVTGYAQIRYVTASGTDLWIFLLVDKLTGEIVSASAASDHPAYGNGGDFNKIPHPFGNYDKTKHDIVLVDKDTTEKLKSEVTQDKSLLTLINEFYKPDMSKEESYIPLHSGKYLSDDGKTQTREMVKTLPDYVKVRKLIKK